MHALQPVLKEMASTIELSMIGDNPTMVGMALCSHDNISLHDNRNNKRSHSKNISREKLWVLSGPLHALCENLRLLEMLSLSGSLKISLTWIIGHVLSYPVDMQHICSLLPQKLLHLIAIESLKYETLSLFVNILQNSVTSHDNTIAFDFFTMKRDELRPLPRSTAEVIA